jgi:aryl-alcohol dehydrogenase-like predicted oxidoreductase
MPVMEQRKLGTRGWVSSSIGLGCMGMSDLYSGRDDVESLSTINAALESGVTLLDSGDFYGMGHNELLISEALKGRKRDSVSLSIKFGAQRDWQGNWLGFDARPNAVKTSLAYSLRRLGTDYIDFYFPGRVDPNVPIEDTIGAIADLVKEGKVRYIGLSEAPAAMLRRAHKVHPISALEIEYSIFSRDIEDETLPAARELGVGILAYGALSRGLLSGTVNEVESLDVGDIRRGLPRFLGPNLQKNLDLVDKLRAFAKEKGATLPQLCIAWVMAQGPEIVTLIGTRRRKNLSENLDAAKLKLSKKDLARVGELVPRGAVSGQRYPAQQMGMVAGR